MTTNVSVHGDGSPVHVLDTNTGDKFLPGKLALGLSYILIDMKAKSDPAYADYLATYQKITYAEFWNVDWKHVGRDGLHVFRGLPEHHRE